MLTGIKNIFIKIPEEYKLEFSGEITQDNLTRTFYISGILIVLESIIYLFLHDDIFVSKVIVFCLIFFSIFMMPVMYYALKNEKCAHHFRQFLCLFFTAGVLAAYCALSIFPQDRLASINTYIMVIFGIAAIICLRPLTCALLFIPTYVLFYILLPYYQPDRGIVYILRINTFVLNALAWVLSVMVFHMRASSFINRKEIEKKNQMLKDMAFRDSMTQLYNHEHAHVKLIEEIDKARRIGYSLSIMMLDIDNFKAINDRFGHIAGDHAIVKTAQVLTETCRKTDILCRYGGDEFFIIMPDTDLKHARSLAERIFANLNHADFGNSVEVMLSGGLSEYKGETSEDLLKDADLKLYLAKSSGKNRFK